MTSTFERRLATFKELKWPHSSNKSYKSQPEDFAQAGFYFRPMAGSIDTVSCYLCFKSLDGWQPNDSAWQEHQNHSSPCPLVTLNLFPSRLRTFDKWPGAKVKGGVKSLAEAGFYYLPRNDSDDTCTCYQCGLSLDGWETDDDPYYEHSRRRPNCPHVVNKEYINPASFEFILGNSPDDLAVCDINSKRTTLNLPPKTPNRKLNRINPPSTTSKSKKIKISVPPQSTSKPNNLTENLTKTTPSNLKNDLLSLFPSAEDKILNWTMEELFDHLIKEKTEMFEKILNKRKI